MFIKRNVLTTVAGVLFAASVFIYIDGGVVAWRMDLPYSYFMYLPQLLCCLGGILLQLVDLTALSGESSSFGEDTDEIRSKVFFFISSVSFFAAVAVAIWKLVDPYSRSGDWWPGVAILVQVVLLIVTFVTLFLKRWVDEDDDL